MAKQKIEYVCESCGFESLKWIGKCPSCGEWNTFREFRTGADAARDMSHGLFHRASGRDGRGDSKPVPLRDVPSQDNRRIDTLDSELNRVLGGGLVPGSLTLIGGHPGIGKSTLLLQTILNLKTMKTLYVSGEESAMQLRMRAERLSPDFAAGQGAQVDVLCETALQKIFEAADSSTPDLVVIDSIQAIASDSIESGPGSVSQIRECAAALLRYAKVSGKPVIIVGHINKEGTIAGPKILEHIVDTVIQFEGDQNNMYRVLRSIKNRFGSTSELGIYEMRQDGLRQVENPSELLLTQYSDGLSGMARSSAIEGVRSFLVETQALVSHAAYGTPQRTANGFDQRRLNMLLAVMEKRVGIRLAQKDVFVNIAGGLRVTDLALDLSVIAAIMSSNVDMPVGTTWCMAGEVGLSGEVRPVSRIEQRLSEAAKLGFTDIIVPRYNLQGIDVKRFDINIHPAQKVEEALRILFA